MSPLVGSNDCAFEDPDDASDGAHRPTKHGSESAGSLQPAELAPLSTLAHKMTHLKQHHQVKPSSTSYHDKERAGLMRRIGMIPSDTGPPRGKKNSQHMTHYIEDGEQFAAACAALSADRASPCPMWSYGMKRENEAAFAFFCGTLLEVLCENMRTVVIGRD